MKKYFFADIEFIGFNGVTASMIIILISLFFEASGLLSQAKAICENNSTKSMSIAMYLYLIFMFLSSLVYGIKTRALLITCNGLLFLFCLPVALELIKRKGLNKNELTLLVICAISIVAMIIFPIKEIVYTIFMLFSVLFLLLQPYEMYKVKSRGVVEIKLIIIYFVTTIFLVYYAFAIKDKLFIGITLLTLFVLGFVIIYWFLLKEKKRRRI